MRTSDAADAVVLHRHGQPDDPSQAWADATAAIDREGGPRVDEPIIELERVRIDRVGVDGDVQRWSGALGGRDAEGADEAILRRQRVRLAIGAQGRARDAGHPLLARADRAQRDCREEGQGEGNTAREAGSDATGGGHGQRQCGVAQLAMVGKGTRLRERLHAVADHTHEGLARGTDGLHPEEGDEIVGVRKGGAQLRGDGRIRRMHDAVVGEGLVQLERFTSGVMAGTRRGAGRRTGGRHERRQANCCDERDGESTHAMCHLFLCHGSWVSSLTIDAPVPPPQ